MRGEAGGNCSLDILTGHHKVATLHTQLNGFCATDSQRHWEGVGRVFEEEDRRAAVAKRGLKN